MTAKEFSGLAREALGGYGWKARLARITGRNYGTVTRWANGDLPVPTYAITIVEMARVSPKALNAVSADR